MRYATLNYLPCEKGILMLRKGIREGDPNSGYCTLPGGNLEAYEKGLKSPRGRLESAIRETKDETGIELIKPVLRGTILFDNEGRLFPDLKKRDNFYVYMYYTAKGEGELKGSEEGKPFWAHSWEEIDSLPKNSGDKLMYEWLRDKNFQKGMFFSGVIKHMGYEIDEEGSWVEWR